ncbi:MAG: hypothetical protein KGI38_03680 [Thaumarchaeota archaeon]|nr:hypothetical protein [Nitrososphaerota archaeon]
MLRYKIFAVYMSFLVFGVVLNDVSAFLGPGTSPYVASMHQTSILLVFFGAFLVGTGAMYDILERRLNLVRGTFVYAALMWCSINSVWAIGYYLLMGALTATPVPEALRGLDAPFSFGFYTPEVPKYAMIAYNAMNLVAVYAIFELKTVRAALAGIFVPVVFVNAYALLLGKIVILPLFNCLRSYAVKAQPCRHRHTRNSLRQPSWAHVAASPRDPLSRGGPLTQVHPCRGLDSGAQI